MLQIIESNCSNMTKQITIVPPRDWFLIKATCSCTSRETHCSRVSRLVWFPLYSSLGSLCLLVVADLLAVTFAGMHSGCVQIAFRLRSGCVHVRSCAFRLRSGAFSVFYGSGAFWVIFCSVGWMLDVNCKSEHSLSTEVSLTTTNRIVLCTDISNTPLLPAQTVQ